MSRVITLGPVGFKPTGAYNNTREYKKLDVVIYQGSSYIAKSDSIGQLPTNTTYWEMLVQKGDTGNGITSIAKTGTSGLVDTYTITYTDETTSTFTVTNGEKGDPGEVTEEQLDEAMARANMVYNALPKVSDEGDNLTLDGTANCPMKMELKGNTEQTTYTGKNLLPNSESLSNTGQYQDVIRFTDLEPSTEYTLKVKGTAGDKFYTGGSMPYSSLTIPSNGVLEFTFTTNSTISDVAIIKNTTATNTLPLTECTLCKGSTATYEPFVGGSPSPSPDYPQDIRVVMGNNSVKVIGKNLYDEDSKSTDKLINSSGIEITNSGFNTSDYILIKGNISYNLSWESASSYFQAFISYYDSNKTFIQRDNITTSNTYTKAFTTLENAKYIRITYSKEVNGTPTPRSNIQLEKGSTATTYEPYQSQTYSINLGTMELCKIGSYQDYIYKDNGKWYLHKEIGKVVLDGSEQWNFNTTKTITQVFEGISPLPNKLSNNYTILNNYFIFNNPGDTEKIALDVTTAIDVYIAINKTTASTVAEFKNWLSTHDVTIYYILATPTNEEITDTTLISQLNAIENAVSYDTQTNIVQENYSEPFIINAECVRSLKDIFELID